MAKLAITNVVEVRYVIKQLQLGKPLAEKYVDHALSGNWHRYRNGHIKPNLLLIYKTDSDILKLAGIGHHSDFFLLSKRQNLISASLPN